MGPRTLESDSYKNKSMNTTVQDDFTPIILHKKHKVVKLVTEQLAKLRAEGFNFKGFVFSSFSLKIFISVHFLFIDFFHRICNDEYDESKSLIIEHHQSAIQDNLGGNLKDSVTIDVTDNLKGGITNDVTKDVRDSLRNDVTNNAKMAQRAIAFSILVLIVLLVLLVVFWASAGPLSNKVPHTPTSVWSSFLTTDGLCTLEKKYLLRWCTMPCLDQ